MALTCGTQPDHSTIAAFVSSMQDEIPSLFAFVLLVCEEEDLLGGTFTVSNGGVFGSLFSTPIPAYPQTAILGMHAIKKRPIVVDDQIVIHPMMYVALTYDHRVIDGREAVSFLARVKEFIEQPDMLLLEM